MPESMYLVISKDLRQKIISGKYLPDDALPSENELASYYNTSRITVRKSLDVLENEGLVKAQHGKGYFVQTPQYAKYTLPFGDQLMKGQYRFQEVNIIHPSKDIAKKLQLKQEQTAIIIRRILEHGDKKLAYDEKFIPYERGAPSIELELKFSEFPDLFYDRFSPMSLHTELTIGIENTPDHICGALGMEECSKSLVVSRLILTADNKPVGYDKQYLTEQYGQLTAWSGYYMERV